MCVCVRDSATPPVTLTRSLSPAYLPLPPVSANQATFISALTLCVIVWSRSFNADLPDSLCVLLPCKLPRGVRSPGSSPSTLSCFPWITRRRKRDVSSHKLSLDPTSHPSGLLICILSLLWFNKPVVTQPCVSRVFVTEDQTELLVWIPGAPIRRTLLMSSSVLSAPPSHPSPLHHQPLPVPWHYHLLSRARRWNVAVFCSRAHCTSRCSLRNLPRKEPRWPSCSLCCLVVRCCGLVLSGVHKAR